MGRFITTVVFAMLSVSGCSQIYDTSEFKVNAPQDSDPTVDCRDYCQTVLDVCVDNHAQYTTTAQCQQICAHMNAGNEADTSGNTLSCRDHFALEAIEAVALHCPSAGPGGNGVCGTNCESFCQLQSQICTGANQQFNSVSACLNVCAGFDDSLSYNSTVLSGNSLACRISHLSLASGAPDTHCTHIAPDSPVCN